MFRSTVQRDKQDQHQLPCTSECCQHCPAYYSYKLHMLVWVLARYNSPGKVLNRWVANQVVVMQGEKEVYMEENCIEKTWYGCSGRKI